MKHDTNILFTLHQLPQVGCYYRDNDDGEQWTAFEMFGGYTTCSACGEQISRGYSRGLWGENAYFCGTHVRIEQKESE